MMMSASAGACKAILCSRASQQDIEPSQIQALVDTYNQQHEICVLLIEDPSQEWCNVLQYAFAIPGDFFGHHHNSTSILAPWSAVLGTRPEDHHLPQRGEQSVTATKISADGKGGTPLPKARPFWHVDGVFEIGHEHREGGEFQHVRSPNAAPRKVHYSDEYGWEVGTKISWCQVTDSFYLWLLDAPPVSVPQGWASAFSAVLHVPVSNNRGGLLIPGIYHNSRYSHSMIQSLAQYFTHSWHFLIMSWDPSMSSEATLYLWVASSWVANFGKLERDIKRIAFNDLRRPNLQINDRLHDCRRALSTLKDRVEKTRTWMPRGVQTELEGALDGSSPPSELRKHSLHVGLPEPRFEKLLADVEPLERFLIDTFQLLMSSMSVLAAESAAREARSSQRLTYLASIYLPLTLVTGIFGMNLMEVNGGGVPWWVALVALLVVVLLTFGGLRGYNAWERHVPEKED